MSPLVQMDVAEVKRFIYERVLNHPRFKAVVAVSVEKYPAEFSAVVWVAQEPDVEMRQYLYDLEAELANLGVPCSILVKTDLELSVGGVHKLRTKKGDFSYRFLRLDPIKDEDLVYVFTVYRGQKSYRVRLSLTGTLASMLRARNRLDEERVLEVYRDRIRQMLGKGTVKPDRLAEVMFNSTDGSLFSAN